MWIKFKNWIKEKWRKIVAFFIVPVAMAAGVSAPVVPTDVSWFVSYETIAFDTKDGDLGMNQYARPNEFTKDGDDIFYIREIEKNKGSFISTSTEPVNKKEVGIVGSACYDEFIKKNGEIRRKKTNCNEYRKHRTVKNNPQPKDTEFVSILNANDADAAIAFDATSNSGLQTNASSYSWSHTVTGSNTLLFLGFGGRDVGSSDMNVTSATYNSVALTSIRRDIATAFGDTATEIMYLIAPTTGSNTVSVTLAGSVQESGAGVVSLTGVDQTTPLDAQDSADGDSNSVSGTITTVADNSWIIETTSHYGAALTSVGANQTERWNLDHGASTQGGSTEVTTTAGSHTMSWSASHVDEWVISIASFEPAAVGNSRPTISSVTDTPDPQTELQDITFSVDWNDADGEGVKTYICDTNATSTTGCGSTTFCSQTASFSTTDPSTCDYTTTNADIAASPVTYYAFVCDNEGDDTACSDTSSGMFSVIAIVPPPATLMDFQDDGVIEFTSGGTLEFTN